MGFLLAMVLLTKAMLILRMAWGCGFNLKIMPMRIGITF